MNVPMTPEANELAAAGEVAPLLLYQRHGAAANTMVRLRKFIPLRDLYAAAARFVVATRASAWGLSCGPPPHSMSTQRGGDLIVPASACWRDQSR
jgi:hypothetical protein